MIKEDTTCHVVLTHPDPVLNPAQSSSIQRYCTIMKHGNCTKKSIWSA